MRTEPVAGQAQCVWLTGDGRELAGQLPALGEVLTITRNAHVILAEYGPYPILRSRADGLAAADDDGHFFTDFTRWHHAEAREEPVTPGNGGHGDGRQSLFSLDFRDADGEAFHRVCLLPDSDLPRFHALVREHETRPGQDAAAGRGVPNAARAGGGEIVAMRRTRLPALLARAAGTGHCGCGRPGCIDEIQPLKLPPATLRTVLDRVAHAAVPLRVSLFQQAIVHTARFTLANPPDGGQPGDEWMFVHDERVGLHLRLSGVAALWFTLPATDSDGESCLEAYDARGELLAAFSPANPAEDEARWRSLVWFR